MNEDGSYTRGCGGIGLIWKRSIGGAPISGIGSDRICGMRLPLSSNHRVMSVFGVYLPCLDQGLEPFRECLQELEGLITESQLHGPVVVMGDFNAHLGSAGNREGMNSQGHLFREF